MSLPGWQHAENTALSGLGDETERLFWPLVLHQPGPGVRLASGTSVSTALLHSLKISDNRRNPARG